ncbi:MAG: amidohydrolase family protein [Flavobacteriaceae bacterium]
MKWTLFVLIPLFFSCAKKNLDVDILIENGTVYNGVDTIPRVSSIGIKADTIVFIGNPDQLSISAKRTIDATGMVVSPGFIDPHTHADRELVNSEEAHNTPFLFQGITTVVVGNDGESVYPTTKFKALLEKHGMGTNVVPLVGHGTIREQVMGKSDNQADAAQIEQMQQLVQQEMDAGAYGMSTGLFYAPGSYSETDEVIALAKTVAQNSGIYDTHLRDESSYTVGLIPAVQEAIEIGRQAKIPVHISHIKCLGTDVWRQSDTLITMIENARKQGIGVSANQYPYDASATGLKSAVVPRWAESGGMDSLFIRYENPMIKPRILREVKANIARRGGPDKLLIVKSPDPLFTGKNLLEISDRLDVPPQVAVFKVLEKGYARVASFNMHPYDIQNFMKQPWVVTGSDGNTGHPRKYGSFPRKYHRYVKKEKLMSLGRFIHQSAAATAEIIGIYHRGQLKKGNFADIIIFNPDTFRDVADYTDAFQLSEGLLFSIINGKLAVDKGVFTNDLHGRILQKGLD